MSKIWLIAFLVTLLPGFGAPLESANAAQTQTSDTPKPYLTLEQLRTKYADKAGHIAKIGGVEVYYKDEGKGPAILMVHGSSSTLHTYDVIAAKLSAHYRVIRYDIPPMGLSGPVSDEQAAHLQPTDIAEGLLEQLGVKEITYVGVSSGGTLGVFLAAKRPDLVKRMILSNTPSDPVDNTHMNPPVDFRDARKEAEQTHFQSADYWRIFFKFYLGEPDRITPNILTQYYDFNRRTPEKNITSLVAQVANHDKAIAAMSAVKAPTLLVWGGRDPLLIPPTADILGGYLNHAQLSKLMLPDVGHYPPLEIPERYAQIIAAYIEAVTPVEPKAPAPQDR